MDERFVSVVASCRNKEKFVKERVESILRQHLSGIRRNSKLSHGG
jgi:hypothetical protein